MPRDAIYGHLNGLRRTIVDEMAATPWWRLKLLMLLFRLCGWALYRGGLTQVLCLPLLVFYRLYSEVLLGIELPPQLDAGRGLTLYHGYGLVVHRDARLGQRCILRQGVCIGNKRRADGTDSGLPVIGDDVEFGVHAVAIGEIHIGDRARIGACTVITRDVPPDTTMVGASARAL